MKTAAEWMDERLEKTIIQDQILLNMYRINWVMPTILMDQAMRLQRLKNKKMTMGMVVCDRKSWSEIDNIIKRSR